jgi:hypothetical protein
MIFRFYDLPKKATPDDLPGIITERSEQFKAKTGLSPSALLVHPTRLESVQPVAPMARTRLADEPLPQPGQLVIGGEDG